MAKRSTLLRALGFEKLDPAEIVGGHSVSDSAKIFSDVLHGDGTAAQNNVVLCKCRHRYPHY
jgi:anthranilate phosphoribosyltransferase